MAGHAVSDTEQDGIATVTLASPEGLQAVFAPGVGMVGASLRDRGEELLGILGGLTAYRDRQSTFGIPLLHPWANRLSGFAYAAAGHAVRLDPSSPVVHKDANGLPMHGVDASARDWQVVAQEAGEEQARLTARLDYGADPARLAAFPYPHVLELDVVLAGRALTVAATLQAGPDGPVPMSFGWHPYFALPGAVRADWRVTVPALEHLELDDRSLPTGRHAPFAALVDVPLGDRTFDDGFGDVPVGAELAVAGGGRRIAVRFDAGYPFAQIYAPGDADVICFEPMTAPASALVSGDRLPIVEAGERRTATFTVVVTDE